MTLRASRRRLSMAVTSIARFWSYTRCGTRYRCRMLARTSTIGVLSLGRFGADAPQFTDSDRKFSDDLAARVALAVENARLYEKARTAIELRDTFPDHRRPRVEDTADFYSGLLAAAVASVEG